MADPTDKTHYDRMVELVERMFSLEEGQRNHSATDRQIDKLVYKLYGLTEEEIKIVEGKL